MDAILEVETHSVMTHLFSCPKFLRLRNFFKAHRIIATSTVQFLYVLM